MGGRGATSERGTGKGKEILQSLMNGQTVRARNPKNSVVFDIHHSGRSAGMDHFISEVVENPKNAHNPQNVMVPLNPGTRSTHSYNNIDNAIDWLDRLQRIK